MKENKGFSLLELLVVVVILGMLSGVAMISPGIARRKEIDKYARTLKEQIEYTQTLSMTREGQWQLTVYEEDGDMYCAQEQKTEADGWTQKLNHSFLGHSGAVSYTKSGELSGEDSSLGGGGSIHGGSGLYWIYRFDRDTGRCIMGNGTVTIAGQGKQALVTVYEETGRCEIH